MERAGVSGGLYVVWLEIPTVWFGRQLIRDHPNTWERNYRIVEFHGDSGEIDSALSGDGEQVVAEGLSTQEFGSHHDFLDKHSKLGET